MEILIPILILVVIVAVALWLIRQLPLEGNLAIIKTILIAIVIILALIRVVKYL